ncbi:MAG: 2-hydroxyacid dehydrogenase [Rhodobacteraceae bacterium]|nr:MAG: 2-hydroxyacid dehydrogenase [Paracoccaceae bacterium]
MPDRPKLLQVGKVLDTMSPRLSAGFEVVKLPDGDPAPFLAEHGEDIAAVATMKGLQDEVLAALPNLKVVSSFGVGYDSIDADACAERGIIVANTPGVLNDEVADTAMMLWLAVSRRLVPSDRWARSGDWEAKGAFPLTRSVRGRKLGIVGFGRIGQTIAKLADAFDAEISYHARSKKDVPFSYYPQLVEMARDSDVLIVITPGGAETRHLISAEVMDALGPEGILINVSRGSVVDEAALVAALEDGRLGGAGLDVFEEEPKIPDALKSMENVVLLPHVGSATVETRTAMGDLVCKNLERWLADGTVVTPVPECRALNG